MAEQRRHQTPAETCSFCGAQTAHLRKKTQAFGQGARLIVIEDVPTFVCDHCHERYITADVSRAIDEILAHPDRHTSLREINVATLAA